MCPCSTCSPVVDGCAGLRRRGDTAWRLQKNLQFSSQRAGGVRDRKALTPLATVQHSLSASLALGAAIDVTICPINSTLQRATPRVRSFVPPRRLWPSVAPLSLIRAASLTVFFDNWLRNTKVNCGKATHTVADMQTLDVSSLSFI